MKPIITRLKFVEYELQEEVTASLKKQQIIEAQQKRIELLQTTNEHLLAKLQTLKQTDNEIVTKYNTTPQKGTVNLSPLIVKQTSTEEKENSNNMIINTFSNNISPAASETSDHSTSISQTSDVYGSSPNLCNSSETNSLERQNLIESSNHKNGDNNNEICIDFSGLKTTEC